MEDNFLTMQQVMTRLQIGYNTLIRYIHKGLIPIVRVSRNKRFIREQDLDKFIQEHTGVYKQ